MARIRTIKPEFWMDEDMACLDAETRLLAIGLLNTADDEGFFRAHPALIKAAVFPFTEHSMNIQSMLKSLALIGYLTLAKGSDGKEYGEITNFTKHQKVNRPYPSKIKPLIVITEDSLNEHEQITSGKEQGTGNREQGIEEADASSDGETGSPSRPSPIQYERIRETWNALGLQQLVLMSDKRKNAIRARTREMIKIRPDLKDVPVHEAWEDLLDHVKNSDFLMGRKTEFTVTFDWLLNPTNFIKIAEGNYHD